MAAGAAPAGSWLARRGLGWVLADTEGALGRVYTVKTHLSPSTEGTLWHLCSGPSGLLVASESRKPARDS